MLSKWLISLVILFKEELTREKFHFDILILTAQEQVWMTWVLFRFEFCSEDSSVCTFLSGMLEVGKAVNPASFHSLVSFWLNSNTALHYGRSNPERAKNWKWFLCDFQVCFVSGTAHVWAPDRKFEKKALFLTFGKVNWTKWLCVFINIFCIVRALDC